MLVIVCVGFESALHFAHHHFRAQQRHLLERMQKSPQLMSAMMELALKGDDAMPEDDEVSSEIRDYLAKMKEIALRSSGGGAGREPPAK